MFPEHDLLNVPSSNSKSKLNPIRISCKYPLLQVNPK